MSSVRISRTGSRRGNSFESVLPAISLLSDERLMASCAGGDTTAFDELFRRYGAYIRNYVSRKINDRDHAEDVTQEIFLRLYRSAARFDATRQLSKWLFTIASNEVRRYWTRNNRTPLSLSRNAHDDSSADFQELLPDSHEGPDEIYLNSITSRKLREAIAALPDYQRTAILMRTYRNMTLKEISELTDTPVATVNSRLHYATEKIRKAMRETGFALPLA